MPIPVQRAETFYLPPPHLPADAWAGVPAAELVFRWYEVRVQRRVPPPEGFVIGQQVYARINHNRWVADCLCGSAQVVSPTDPRTACTECGLGWIVVVFPEDPAAIEESLAELLPDQRNWTHPEDPGSAPPAASPDPTPAPEATG
ncbi:hypothetical protein OG302_22270 [Streptomyces sp. NBC_01283]|uniref:hypothetical protein n=1 Tax=Streptomyces sp. NBC_01283 TaxID=2903812 RepID=UPI00352D8DA9|nr:hypothetical protein OG302_22270 [Streptomyces sp. NBC_01283]